MFPIKEERNASYFVLWPFKFVLTSVKFQMSGHLNKHSRNGIFHRLLDVCVCVCACVRGCSPSLSVHLAPRS